MKNAETKYPKTPHIIGSLDLVYILMEPYGQVEEAGARTVGVRKPEGELNVGRHWAGEFMSHCGTGRAMAGR